MTQDLKQRWSEEDQQEIEEQYRQLLSTPRGRKFLYYQLGVAKVGQQPFATNAMQTSFNCGELNVGNRFLADILATNPDGWVLMQKEATDEYRNRERAISRHAAGYTD